MVLTVTAVDTGVFYEFTVTDGTEENTFVYDYTKTLPDGAAETQYLQECKNNSLGLAQAEIDAKQPPQQLNI